MRKPSCFRSLIRHIPTVPAQGLWTARCESPGQAVRERWNGRHERRLPCFDRARPDGDGRENRARSRRRALRNARPRRNRDRRLRGARRKLDGGNLFPARARRGRGARASSVGLAGEARGRHSPSSALRRATGSPPASKACSRSKPAASSSMARTTARGCPPTASASRSRRRSPSEPGITAPPGAACWRWTPS